MEREFIRVRSAKDIFTTLILITAGGIMIALPTSQAVNVAGFFLIFAGLVLGIILKTGYKDTESGINYYKKERFFAQNLRDDIARKIQGNLNGINLAEEDKGNGLRLDIYYSKASGKAFIQLFEYIPYKYEPCSKMYEHSLTDAADLSR